MFSTEFQASVSHHFPPANWLKRGRGDQTAIFRLWDNARVIKNDWPANLDALVAAPEHHRLLMENEHVRVVETLIPPGETTKTHTHEWPGSLYVLSWTAFIRYDADGNELFDSRSVLPAPEVGSSMWSQPLPPHYVTNVGTTDLRIVATEIKTEPFVSFNSQEPHSSKDWPK